VEEEEEEEEKEEEFLAKRARKITTVLSASSPFISLTRSLSIQRLDSRLFRLLEEIVLGKID